VSPGTPAPHAIDARWDELRARLEAMRPGQLLLLTARDPGARADIPAWCRMTGHTLVAEQHPVYQIRRKEN